MSFFKPAILGVFGDLAGVFMSFFKPPIFGVFGDLAGVFISFFKPPIFGVFKSFISGVFDGVLKSLFIALVSGVLASGVLKNSFLKHELISIVKYYFIGNNIYKTYLALESKGDTNVSKGTFGVLIESKSKAV